MIITLTGKPCSGKGTAAKIFCEKHNFEYLSAGQMMRDIAKAHGYPDVLSFTQNENIRETDLALEKWTESFGKEHLNDDVLIDARLAWFTIPKSFKVFLDVSLDTAAKRLLNANRQNEQVKNLDDAKESLSARWNRENVRYKATYGVDNTDMSRYNLVISSENISPEEIADKIYTEYVKFINK